MSPAAAASKSTALESESCWCFHRWALSCTPWGLWERRGKAKSMTTSPAEASSWRRTRCAAARWCWGSWKSLFRHFLMLSLNFLCLRQSARTSRKSPMSRCRWESRWWWRWGFVRWERAVRCHRTLRCRLSATCGWSTRWRSGDC